MNADLAHCRAVIAEHSKSFALASRLFPPRRRDDVAAVYAFCRWCDDAVDHASAEALPTALDGLEKRLASIYAGEAQADPVARAFQAVARAHRIPAAYPRELVAGMAMDVRGHEYASPDDLLLYAWRVAGTVGLMMCHVMGVARPEAVVNAAHLGMAMQLTNVCRDVAEDWSRGRLYLPAALFEPETAARLRYERGRALPLWAAEAIAGAVRRLLAWADAYYASGDRGLAALEPRSALAVRTARRIYAEIGREIERRDFAVLAGRAVVSKPRKLALLAACAARFAAERRARRDLAMAPPDRVLAFGDALRLPLPPDPEAPR